MPFHQLTDEKALAAFSVRTPDNRAEFYAAVAAAHRCGAVWAAWQFARETAAQSTPGLPRALRPALDAARARFAKRRAAERLRPADPLAARASALLTPDARKRLVLNSVLASTLIRTSPGASTEVPLTPAHVDVQQRRLTSWGPPPPGKRASVQVAVPFDRWYAGYGNFGVYERSANTRCTLAIDDDWGHTVLLPGLARIGLPDGRTTLVLGVDPQTPAAGPGPWRVWALAHRRDDLEETGEAWRADWTPTLATITPSNDPAVPPLLRWQPPTPAA
jgi:hypothetical protein